MKRLIGVGDACLAAHSDDGAVQGFQLGGAAAFEIGVHGVLEVGEPLDEFDLLLDKVTREVDAPGTAHLVDLAHGLGEQVEANGGSDELPDAGLERHW